MAPLDSVAVPFPLRQHHVADATGLTTGHVSNVLGEFRKRGIVELVDRMLKILDRKQLLKLSALRAK